MNDARPQDPVVRLLSILVVLVALLVVGLGVGGLLIVREFSRVRAAIGGSRGQQDLTAVRDTVKRSADLLDEATRRQEALSDSLGARADKSLEQLQTLRQRRAALGGVRKGLGTVAQTVELTQTMADEMLLLLDHVMHTQAAVAKALRPLPTQRELQESGTGGAGKGGSGKSGGGGTK